MGPRTCIIGKLSAEISPAFAFEAEGYTKISYLFSITLTRAFFENRGASLRVAHAKRE